MHAPPDIDRHTYILRLRATGVTDVENPVSAATHQGRLEEIGK